MFFCVCTLFLYLCMPVCMYMCVCMYLCVCMHVFMYVGMFACSYACKFDPPVIHVCMNIYMTVCVREQCRLRMRTNFHAFPLAITFGYSTHFCQFAYSKLCRYVIDCAETCGYVLDAHGHGQPGYYNIMFKHRTWVGVRSSPLCYRSQVQ
jgi:hypothetical protein